MQRVVVTGLGAVTSLGHSLEQTYKGLISGQSGIDRICSFDVSKHATQIAAEYETFPLMIISRPKNYASMIAFLSLHGSQRKKRWNNLD